MRLSHALPVVLAATALYSLSGCSQCTAQHDPYPDRERFAKEEEIANKPTPILDEGGKLPEKVAAAAETPAAAAGDPIDQKYQMFCSTCHGVNGDGNGAGAAALNPKPRNFHDAAWQAKVTDEHIAKVIKDGGAAVGLSPTMTAWGSALSEEELTAMVKKVRAFKQ